MNVKSRECLDLIALNLIEGLGACTIKKLIEHAGCAEKIFSMKNSELGEVSRVSISVLGKIHSAKDSDEYKKELEYIEKEGINVVCLADENYPENLKEIYDPPPVIYYKGVMPEKKELCVAIVGSRQCSLYGMRSAEKLSGGLVEAGVTVVSGMASGIDAAAHRGVLQAGGRTIAVMGTGFRYLYPEGSEKIVRDICRRGAVITEFPSGISPSKITFPRRNRIISGMSSAVVVVEAAKKSGALITVDFALEQGKDVFAVPGPIDSPTSKGTNALIQNGAKLLTSTQDILDEILPWMPQGEPINETEITSFSYSDVSEEQGKILSLLPEGGKAHIDEISASSGIASGKIHGILLSLELKGMVRPCPGAMYERAAG